MTPRQLDWFRLLLGPFPIEAHRARNQGDRVLIYLRSRVIMNRLDDVASPLGWTTEFTATEHGQKCRLKILCPDHTEDGWAWHYKEDGAGTESMGDDTDNSEKSSFTNAFRRAAMVWGFGRYLYEEGMPEYLADLYVGFVADLKAAFPPAARGYSRASSAAPASAYAGRSAPPPNARRSPPAGQRQQAPRGGFDDLSAPPTRPGRACYAWCRQLGDRYGVDFVKIGQDFSRTQWGTWRSDELDEQQLAVMTEHIIQHARQLPHYDGLFEGGNGS